VDDLLNIARSRSSLVEAEVLASLPRDIQAIQRSLSAKGLVKSGRMLKEVRGAAEAALDRMSDSLIQNYTWCVEQSVAASQSWMLELRDDAISRLAPVQKAGVAEIERACVLAGTPHLSARLVADLDSKYLSAEEKLRVELQAAFEVRKRGLVRKLLSTLGRMLPGVFTGGAK
jgi:hypothetical protein